MGACAALVSLEQTIHHIMNDDKYSLSLHQQQQITSMNQSTISLQTFLERFPKKVNNDSLRGRVRDAAIEAERIMEYFMWRTINPRWLTWMAKIIFHFDLEKVAKQIESIAEEVSDSIKEARPRDDVDDVGVCDGGSRAATSTLSRRYSAPTGKEVAVVGFDGDLLAIQKRLCGQSSRSRLEVIPIVGMGGIGKTTLARYAYDDPLITEHFQIRAWVTVSQDYSSAHEVLLSLLDSLKEYNTERFGRGFTNEEKVRRSLKGKRYLIVMDDIWSTKPWDDVRRMFPDDINGSRVMLTTRMSDVAAYASRANHHFMQFMNADQSWALLCRKVFGNKDCPHEIKHIGRKIAEGCRGLPLAIVLIGGLLSTVNKTRASWGEIAENVNSAIHATRDGQFEEILSLSYNHLPHHLRPCFLYMAGFPNDYEIHVSTLIRLWVAEGFMKPMEGSETSEKTAERHFLDLVKRNLVLVMKRKSCNGKIKTCSIHDLVRDLCIKKAHEEKFFVHTMDRSSVVEVDQESIKNQCRASVDCSDLNSLGKIYGSNIRTIMCFRSIGIDPLRSLGNFRLLRVLIDMVKDSRSRPSLPPEIFKLFLLRYLALSYPVEVQNPTSISNLGNLQTLIILPSTQHLPLDIWRMPQLRHLVSSSVDLSEYPQEASCVLENLQTLSGVRNLICTRRILQKIPNLRKMAISYKGYERDEDYHLDNLVHLHLLENLTLGMHGTCPFQERYNPAFPTSLQKLTLSGWRFAWKDMKIVGSLPNLQVLKLKDSGFKDGEKWETAEGEFPQLKFLLIEKSQLEEWITESSHFPSLKCLQLHHCPYLREIPCVIGEIPTLELIEVKGVNKSLVESAKQIQKEQQDDWGNFALQVRCFDF